MKLLTEEEIADFNSETLGPFRMVAGIVHRDYCNGSHCTACVRATDAIERMPALLSEVERSRALLKRIRRAGVDENDNAACPECKATFAEPCKPDCELAALIGKTP